MTQDRINSLDHILWIGGGTDAGKSSVAKLIADRNNYALYTFDQNEMDHIHRLLANGSDYYKAFMAMSEDERWVLREPAEMAEGTIFGWTERFAMVLEDLMNMPRNKIILAEGPGFFPESVAPVIGSKHQAVWLVPTDEFKWASMARRGKIERRQKMSDPERAVNNLFARDMLMAKHVAQEAKLRNLMVFEVDGSLSINEMAEKIEEHFHPFLS